MLTNPLARIWCEDARTLLKLSPRKYDLIITEPSNPWTSGVGSVFSKEFYQLAASRLKPGGLMAQWFHIYELHDEIVAMVFRTFSSVFPNMEIWDTSVGDLVLLGSMEPWPSNPSIYSRSFEREEVRKDFERIGIQMPQSFWARQLASQRTAFAIAGLGPVQSDAFPVLEYAAPRAFYIGNKAEAFAQFDERTWQMTLAPEEKQFSLAQLTPEILNSLFAEFGSVNHQLRDHLRWNFNIGKDSTNQVQVALPCIFSTNGLAQLAPSLGSDELKKLKAAAEDLERQGPAKTEAIQTILASLHAYTPKSGWPVVYYAALGARACLSLGDIPRAQEILRRSLELEPGDSQLGYLMRISERQQLLSNAAPSGNSKQVQASSHSALAANDISLNR